MTKKKLLMVVGAGASLDFDMPSVSGVHEIINERMQAHYPLDLQPGTNLYVWIRDAIARHWTTFVPAHLRRSPHFEDVLYTIFALSAAFPSGADTSSLGALITPTAMPDVNFMARQKRSAGPNLLEELGHAAIDALVSELRARCTRVETKHAAEFAKLKHLVTALQDEFEIAIVTLNYDDVLLRALPDLETGFNDKGRFDEQRIFTRNWPCLLHLHGSVHFNQVMAEGDLHHICWQDDLSQSFQSNAAGRSGQTSTEGATFPNSIVVAGYGKTTQILRRPFRTYYSELDRLVSQCDALLFAGYGFGDVHLNKAFETFRDHRNRPVTVLGHAQAGDMNLCGVEIGEYNTFANGLLHTFRTDYRSMSALGSTAPATVDRLLDANEFEISNESSTPLAVWYGGLLQACAHAQNVVARLS